MRKKTAIIAGSTAGLLAFVPVAIADALDAGNDNDVAAPLQLCANRVVEEVGAVVPEQSPQLNDCTNA